MKFCVDVGGVIGRINSLNLFKRCRFEGRGGDGSKRRNLGGDESVEEIDEFCIEDGTSGFVIMLLMLVVETFF